MRDFDLDFDLVPILVTVVVLTFLLGIGYLITIDMARQERVYNTCIASGKQYIHGDCVK